MRNKIVVLLKDHRNNTERDIEVDLEITAYELFAGLNSAYGWNCNLQDSNECYLVAENPIVLLRGGAPLKSFGLRDGSVVHFIRDR